MDVMREKVLFETFLKLHKLYSNIEQDMCLEIMEGCGIVPWYLWLLHQYWELLIMVNRASGYYVTSFKGYC